MKRFPLLQNIIKSTGAIGLLLFCSQQGFAQVTPNANGVVFVNINVSGGSNSGNSWANAVPELADALKAAHSNAAIQQIWVAKGTYMPLYSAGSDGMNPYLQFGLPGAVFNSFLMVNNVKLYGGFQNANETSTGQRDTVNNNTYLNGTGCNHTVMSVGNAGTAEINGFTIINGHAANAQNLTVNSMVTYAARGGGMYIESSSPVISNCTISNNTAEWGAGIYANNNMLNIRNTAITGNHATGGPIGTTNSNAMSFGGGIYAREAISVSINNCNISSNTVSAVVTGAWGGGIYITGYSCTASILNTTISNNTVTAVITGTYSNGSAQGGGLFLVTASATIDNCTINNNNVTLSTAAATAMNSLNYNYSGGGGILNGGPLVISNSTISNNHVSGMANPSNNSKGWCSGGGLMNDGGLIPGNGGGMVTGSNSKINNCIIDGNSISGNFNSSGGGIGYNTPFLLVTPVIPQINNSIIRNNTSDKYGGGLHCFALSPRIKNTLISNNTAADGGAIYNVPNGQAAKPLLVNCTVYGNEATAANASVITNKDSCTTTMHNSILYGNNGNITTAGTTTISYSIVQGNTIYAGTGNSNADPVFYNAGNGDFTLTTSSPAANTGNDTAYSLVGIISADTDLAGNPRLYGSAIDMGAYELQKKADPPPPATAIADVNMAARNITAYPNPVRAGQMLTLRCDYKADVLSGARLIVTDVTGKVQQTYASVKAVQTLVLDRAGTYFITLTLKSGERVTVPVVVE